MTGKLPLFLNECHFRISKHSHFNDLSLGQQSYVQTNLPKQHDQCKSETLHASFSPYITGLCNFLSRGPRETNTRAERSRCLMRQQQNENTFHGRAGVGETITISTKAMSSIEDDVYAWVVRGLLIEMFYLSFGEWAGEQARWCFGMRPVLLHAHFHSVSCSFSSLSFLSPSISHFALEKVKNPKRFFPLSFFLVLAMMIISLVCVALIRGTARSVDLETCLRFHRTLE